MHDNEYILVTGGAGYIGSHTNKALDRCGYKTVVLDNLVNGHHELVKWGEFVEGDLKDLDTVCAVFKKYSIKAVMHFAAFAYVGESMEHPQRYYANNVANTINLLSVMNEFNVRNIIFSSSCTTYGEPEELPITEDHSQNPVNPYGRSKLMVERILQDSQKAYGLRYVILRYFNAAGADPDAELGEWHEPETHLIPLVLDAAAGKKDCIKVLGTDYDTKDGTCIRDYIHVSDLAEAHVLGLEYLFKGNEEGVFNLGNGNGYSVKEIIETAGKITGRKINVINSDRRLGDPAALVGSSKKAESILGWSPAYSDIEKIVGSAWVWHRKKNLLVKEKRENE